MRKYLFFITFCLALQAAAQALFDFSTAHRGPMIGPLHYGIFYEEINHAGDGGLYAQLVRNGSMEENASNPDYWWTIGDATFSISSQNLLNGAQKHAMHLNLNNPGDGTRNIGYWGINIVSGQKYRASLWLRSANGWTGDVTLTLESYEGQDLGHAVVHVDDGSVWKKYTAEITATGSYQLGWFAIRGSRAGTIYIDAVSLMPPTYKNRENGMRRDLAEKLAALHPRFMRFPGGCYVEGGNRYQWRHTVGPVEERLGIYNSHWGYPVSNGMGYHEFLQLAEDLGAEPLFVVNVGMGHGWFQDYRHIEGFIQEALDAIEYANGDVTTFWGAKRAAAGHPEPFNLRLMEIGNENYNYTSTDNRDQSDHYAERYHQFYQAIKARYPEMTLIGNSDWGSDYPTWRNAYPLEIIDEHFYRSPDWFAGMYHKYDNYSRSSNKVYNGEYAVTSDFGTNGTLKAALGEAIYMAGMERNSDVCVMASYAPIFMNENEAQWRPDMLHYNAYASFGTPSYWAQQMMASNVGQQNLTWTETGNSVSILHAKLGLGSWGTDVTYSNIKVTDAEGNVLDGFPVESVTSPASTHGTSTTFDIDTYGTTIELDAVKNSGDEGFLIAFAEGDAGNYAWWNIGGWGNARHGVEQAVNGSKRTLATSDGTIATGQTYHIKVVRQGLNVRCYLDGELVHNVTLSADAGQQLFVCAALRSAQNDASGQTEGAENAAIVKVINYGGTDVPATFRFSDATISGSAQLRVMSHTDNYAENSMAEPMKVSPKNATIAVTPPDDAAGRPRIDYTVPAYSLSVITIPLSDVSADVSQTTDTPPAPVISYSFDDGQPQDDAATLKGSLVDGAAILQLSDGGTALYTGPITPDGTAQDETGSAAGTAGYLDLGHEAATAIVNLLNGDACSVSINILPNGPGQLGSYCWAWNVNNGTGSYIGLINQGGNRNWYFEKVRSGTCKASSEAGLSQGQWHNITVCIDAAADASAATTAAPSVRLYIDGQLRATTSANTTPLTLLNTTRAWLGRSPFTADALMSETFFDDFRIYDSALTPEHVRALYAEATGKSTECAALQPQTDTEPSDEAVATIGGGTEVDITSLLTNPHFEDGSNGWEGTPFSAAPGTVAEHYYQIFDTYQVLRRMPAGTYRLSWQGFYRNGNIGNAHLRHEQGTEGTAEVYVKAINPLAADSPSGEQQGDGLLRAMPLLSIYDDAVPYTFSPYTYPDNVSTAETAFSDGHYQQQMTFDLTATSDLRIGLRHFTPTVYDWACVDNFRLVYVGSEADWIKDIIGKQSEENGIAASGQCFDLSGRRIAHRHALKKGIYILNGKKTVIR